MAKAIIIYGVDIETSPGALDSQGAWQKMPVAILYKFREILRQRGYTAELESTTNYAKLPTD